MARSTKAEKARQLNAALGLLQSHVALPEAVQRLSRKFDLSERQAYRYLEEASELDRPVEVAEVYSTDHAQASAEHSGTAAEIRAKQWPNHWSDRDTRVELVSTRSKKTWLSRGSKAAHGKFTFPIHLIACSSQSSRRPTIFWCPRGSAPSAGV